VQSERVPRIESVFLRDGTLGVSKPAKRWVATQSFLRQPLQLIEIWMER
jgi:hypothetical protein